MCIRCPGQVTSQKTGTLRDDDALESALFASKNQDGALAKCRIYWKMHINPKVRAAQPDISDDDPSDARFHFSFRGRFSLGLVSLWHHISVSHSSVHQGKQHDKMRYHLLSALSLSLATAAPASEALRHEDIAVADLYVRMLPENNTVTNISFRISGDNATALDCIRQDPGLPSPVFTCGDSKYRFALYKGKVTDYALRLYHELGTG